MGGATCFCITHAVQLCTDIKHTNIYISIQYISINTFIASVSLYPHLLPSQIKSYLFSVTTTKSHKHNRMRCNQQTNAKYASLNIVYIRVFVYTLSGDVCVCC